MIALLLFVACASLPGRADQVSGTVRDTSGAAVARAVVVTRTASGAEQQTVSSPDGGFTIPVDGNEALLIVRADGFAEHRQPLRSGGQPLNIVLAPATLSETVTVTAARAEQRARDVAASVNILSRDDIDRSAAMVADDVLRQIPTFSLFRRTSSLASHPTAQGVSLRGIGPSGVSRTLVLFDGIPFNDPFGGWVYWTRVPLASVDRIEVVDGANSSVYGNYAMGGIINLVPAPPGRRTLELRSQYGSRNTPKIDFSGTDSWGRVQASVDGSLFDTEGYPIVRAEERGAVDTKAAVRFGNLTGRLQYDFSNRAHGFVRAWHFREERDNAKISTIDGTAEANDTSWTSVSGGVRVRLPDESDLRVSLFTDFVRFGSNFLAVPAATPARSVGRMTLNQSVPADGIGTVANWARALGTRHFFTAGVDWRAVDGESREDVLDAQTGSQVTIQRITGGVQQSGGIFLQDLITPTDRLILTLAARIDHWRNLDGHHLETSVPSNEPTSNHRPTLPERSDTVLSPRMSALYHVADRVSVWGSLGSGFRAPTLNELYRQFRVGAVTTLANSQLGPERLLGTEVGIRVAPSSQLTWRTTVFDNRVEDAVSNVTIGGEPGNVLQQRQNLGRTRIRGVQTDVEYRLRPSFRISGAYVYNSATVREFETNPSLVGNFLPQVPRHRGTLQAFYSNPAVVSISVSLQATGRQFDDDQNVRTVPGETEPGLPGYALVDAIASRRVTRNVELFGAVQNLFNRDYVVGTLPTTIGSPRMIQGGVRVRFASR
jgi:iron complex outermembrane recepter protein